MLVIKSRKAKEKNKTKNWSGMELSLVAQGNIKKQKWHIYNTIIKSIILHGAEILNMTEADKEKVMVIEMSALRSCRISRLNRVRNEKISVIMNVPHTILDGIGIK